MFGLAPRRGATRRATVLAVVLSIVVVSCGGATTEDEGTVSRSLADLGLTASDGESGLAEAGDPVRGGKLLIYGVGADTATYCLPEAQLATTGMTIARAIYDTLMVVSADGTPVPYLAESVESDDFVNWTVTLRDGITFHDGSDLTAEVVKNNLDAYRGLYPGRTSLLLSFTLADIAETTVVDDLTLEIVTSRPWVGFPSYLTGPRQSIMAQAQLDDPDCNDNLVGTGPFVLDTWEPSNFMRVTRNPDYWQIAPDGEPYPYVDGIEFRFIVDGQIRSQSFEGEDLDLLQSAGAAELGGGYLDLRNEGRANMFVSQAGAEVDFLQLNQTVEPFDDVRVRRALAMAVDRDRMNEIINDGHLTVATGPYAPDSMAYLADAGYPAYDPEGARALVAEYEADGGDPSFTLAVIPEPTVRRTGELIQQAAGEVGIDVQLTTRDQPALISDAIGKAYQAQLFRNFPGGDPDNTYVWFYGGTDNPDGTRSLNPVNFAGFDNEEINRLLDEGRSETDPEVREEIYQDVNRQMASQVHGLWLWPTVWGVVEQPDVHGVLGPTLPDGSDPGLQLTYGHALHGLWRTS